MSSTQEKYKTLLDRLYDRTVERKIKWEVDLIGDHTFSCIVGANTIELSEGRSDSHDPIVAVTIRDSSGKVVETFTDEDLSGVPVSGGRFVSYWQMLGEIITLARRQESGADEVLDELINSLNEFPF